MTDTKHAPEPVPPYGQPGSFIPKLARRSPPLGEPEAWSPPPLDITLDGDKPWSDAPNATPLYDLDAVRLLLQEHMGQPINRITISPTPSLGQVAALCRLHFTHGVPLPDDLFIVNPKYGGNEE